MQLLKDICDRTNLSLEDARMILLDIRTDWDTTETITDAEANLIKQSAIALPAGEIAPVDGMPIEKQQQMIDNASQVLGFELSLKDAQKLMAIDSHKRAFNNVALSIIDYRDAEFEEAVIAREEAQVICRVRAIEALVPQKRVFKAVTQSQETAISSLKEANDKMTALLTQLGE